MASAAAVAATAAPAKTSSARKSSPSCGDLVDLADGGMNNELGSVENVKFGRPRRATGRGTVRDTSGSPGPAGARRAGGGGRYQCGNIFCVTG